MKRKKLFMLWGFVLLVCLFLSQTSFASKGIAKPNFDLTLSANGNMEKNSQVTLDYSFRLKNGFQDHKGDKGLVSIVINPLGRWTDTLWQESIPVTYDENGSYSGTFSFFNPQSDAQGLAVWFLMECDGIKGHDCRYIVYTDNGAKLVNVWDTYPHNPLPNLIKKAEPKKEIPLKPYKKSPAELTQQELQTEYYFAVQVKTDKDRQAVEKIVGVLPDSCLAEKSRKVYLIKTTLDNIFKVRDLGVDCEIFEKRPEMKKSQQNSKKDLESSPPPNLLLNPMTASHLLAAMD